MLEDRKQNSEIIARGIIRVGADKIVLCRVKGANWYFLPGGHVEFGESSIQAFERECIEEMGISSVSVTGLSGIVENSFDLDDGRHHEVNIILSATIPEDEKVESIEDHLEFSVVSMSDLNGLKLMPPKIDEIIKKSVNSNDVAWTITQE